MSFITVLRLVMLSLSLFFTLIVIGLTAHMTSSSMMYANTFFDFEVLALVTGAISLLTLPLFLIVGAIRKGSFLNMIVFELPVLGLLWVLWLATSVLIADWSLILFPAGCGDVDLNSINVTFCQEFTAVEGISFVSWIMMFIYSIILIVFALIGKSRGNKIWTLSVSEAPFLVHRNQNANVLSMTPSSTANFGLKPQSLVQSYNGQSTPAGYQYSNPSSTPHTGYNGQYPQV